MNIQNKNKRLQKLINKQGIYWSPIHDFIFGQTVLEDQTILTI